MNRIAGAIVVVIASTLALASPASAASRPDLRTTIAPPPLTDVGATGRYVVAVANVGKKDAGATTVTIALPRTHTSPQVHVLGTLGARSTGCTQSGTNLVCGINQIRKGATASVYFDIALPQNATPIVFTATAATANDANPGNDTASVTAAVRYLNVAGAPSGTATNRHCTGTALTAFFECRLFPSSISSHVSEFQGGPTSGTITITGYASFSGTWSLSGSNNSHLVFQYFDGGSLLATFSGDGVRSSALGHCYEGLTTFPTGTYVSPYEVCF